MSGDLEAGRDESGSTLPAPVDVLLVNYRTPELTLRAVRHLAGPDVSFFVRDNSGDVEAAALTAAAGTAPVRLRHEGGNSMYAAGNNELYALGNAPYVVLLNPDVELGRDALAVMVDGLLADDSVWAVTPRLLNLDGSAQEYYRRFPTLLTVLCDRVPPLRRVFSTTWSRHVYAGEQVHRNQYVESPPGACLMIDRSQTPIPLFDDRLRLFFNDTDLCLRMAQLGRRVSVVPGATARHARGASLAEARSDDRWLVARMYDADCLRYARKHLRGWPLVALVVGCRRLAEYGIRIARRGAGSPG